jgi:retron-type reverse transcriptase
MNKDLFIYFIDYEKAFDRVNHEKVIKRLQAIGIDGKDPRLITNIYWDQAAEMRTEAGTTKSIPIKRGVRQGCILSPYLFNL